MPDLKCASATDAASELSGRLDSSKFCRELSLATAVGEACLLKEEESYSLMSGALGLCARRWIGIIIRMMWEFLLNQKPAFVVAIYPWVPT